MKITKGEIALLLGTVTIVAVVLIGGRWLSQAKEGVAGRYQFIACFADESPSKIGQGPDIELKPDGRWEWGMNLGTDDSQPGSTGTYTVKGNQITMAYLNPNRGNPGKVSTITGHLTKDQLILEDILATTAYRHHTIRYRKIR